MYHVERHIIRKNNKFYKEIDNLCFLSKNLYNTCNYLIRQNYFNWLQCSGQTDIYTNGKDFKNHKPEWVYDSIVLQNGCTNQKYLNNVLLDKLLTRKNNKDYRSLPSKVSKQVLHQVHRNWLSYFKLLKNKSIRNKIPNYKEKLKGRNNLTYELGAISKKELKKGFIKLSGTDIKVPFINKDKKIKEVRIIKNNIYYVIEIVYEVNYKEKKKGNRCLSVDLGINNLLTITNNYGERPIIINGKHIKTINQFFNKKLAYLKSELPVNIKSSNKIKEFIDKRNRKINHEFHKISNSFLKICEQCDISYVIIGYNGGWKQNVSLNKKTNQSFVNIPFLKLINQIKYKLLKNGIETKLVNESYTSKCSFIDDEIIGKHECYSGRRVKRGLFKSKVGFKINADVNASFNILKKVVPDYRWDRGLAVNPLKVNMAL